MRSYWLTGSITSWFSLAISSSELGLLGSLPNKPLSLSDVVVTEFWGYQDAKTVNFWFKLCKSTKTYCWPLTSSFISFFSILYLRGKTSWCLRLQQTKLTNLLERLPSGIFILIISLNTRCPTPSIFSVYFISLPYVTFTKYSFSARTSAVKF